MDLKYVYSRTAYSDAASNYKINVHSYVYVMYALLRYNVLPIFTKHSDISVRLFRVNGE